MAQIIPLFQQPSDISEPVIEQRAMPRIVRPQPWSQSEMALIEKVRMHILTSDISDTTRREVNKAIGLFQEFKR